MGRILSPSFTRSLTPVKGLSSVLKGPTEGPWMLVLPCTEAPKAGGLGWGCDRTVTGLAGQAPLSMGFPRGQYWGGLPFLSPGDLPNPGIEPASPASAGGLFTAEPPGKPPYFVTKHLLGAR